MSDEHPFSREHLAEGLKALDDLPSNEVHAGVVARDHQVGVEAAGRVDIGTKGAFVEGEASWFTRAGWSVAALVGWRRKS